MKPGPFRWAAVDPWRAARVALGVLIPLAAGAASGHPEYGVFAALGALPAGFASFQGVTRSRVVAVAVASAGMAASTFIGATTAATNPWLLVPVVVVLGYAAGLAASLGPLWGVVALQWAVALVIAVGLPLGPAEAALRAGLVLAGGLFQGVLVAASWALRRGEAERTALATSYRSLAGYASALTAGRLGPPPPTVFPATVTLEDPNPLLLGRDRLLLLDLLEEAERVRAALAALAVQAAGSRRDAGESVRSFAAGVAMVLDQVAGALVAVRSQRAGRVRELNRRLAGLTVAANEGWRWTGEALLGQLRAVAGILAHLDAVPVEPPAAGVESGPALPGAEGGTGAALAALRADLSLSSDVGRHALRLAVVAGLAQVVVLATGLNEGRWVVLTVFLLFKPDYSSTLFRGVQRSVGTALGAGLGAAAAQLGHMGRGGVLAAAGVCIAAAYAVFDVSYLLFSVFLTGFVVVMLDVLGSPAVITAEARLAATAIGAGLALTAYFLWPTWESLTAHEKLARLLEAHGAYATALLQQLAHPGRLGRTQLRGLEAAARRARSDAVESTARLSDEPSHPPLTPAVARALMAAVHRMVSAELALHALVHAGTTGKEGDGGAARQLDALAAALGTTMSGLAVALRNLQPPPPLPALRPFQAALRGQAAPLVALTDSLVDAADTLAAILRDHFPVLPSAAPAARHGQLGIDR